MALMRRGTIPSSFSIRCTKYRKHWLNNAETHELLRSVWREADAWLLGRYVVMPDHIHFFATPGKLEIGYENWVKYWKSQFTKRHGNKNHRWLPDHWDVRMRTAEQNVEKGEYVLRNPVRHGLFERPEEWPYQGEIFRIPWN